MISRQRRLAEAYLTARETVISNGYSQEIEWQEARDFASLSESQFLEQAAWVIMSCGMRESVVRARFPRVSEAFLNWESASLIWQNIRLCKKRALRAFNNAGKIEAIGSICHKVADQGFADIHDRIGREGIDFLMQFAYIGPVTVLHLAKNIGLDFTKPDRHLVRLAKAAMISTPAELCEEVAKITGDRVAVIDLVFWRYATLTHEYASLFNQAARPTR